MRGQPQIIIHIMSKLLVALSAITLLALLATHLHGGKVEAKTHRVMFDNWMRRHGKTYPSEQEKNFRLSKFLENAIYVEEHNARF